MSELITTNEFNELLLSKGVSNRSCKLLLKNLNSDFKPVLSKLN